MKRWTIVVLALAAACGHDDGSDDRSPDMSLDLSTEERDGGSDPAACFTGLLDSPIGGECNCDQDCARGSGCVPEDAAGAPRGVCGTDCSVATGEGCPGGFSCQSLPFSADDQGLCWQDCAVDGDCRDGWSCRYGRCDFFCTGDTQCLSGSCDPYTRSCNEGPYPDAGGVLAECTRPEECRSTICLPDIGGHCLVPCSPASGCPDDATCVTNIDPDDLDAGVCMLRCDTDEDCPGSLECLSTGDGRTACWTAG